MATKDTPDAKRITGWPFRADLPQRYSANYSKYISRGGAVNLQEDVRGFIAGKDSNKNDMARFYFFCLLVDQIVKEGLTGDIAELGVYKGNTATFLAKIARRLGTTAYLLDTYKGFNQADLTGIDATASMGFTDTSLEAVRKLVGEDSVRYIKGYFPDSASQIPENLRFCIVHLDCDLYAPMLSALEYFYPRLIPGGFLIVHDYTSLHWKGAEKAADEFFADKPESLIPLPDGAGSAVIRKARAADRYSNWLVQKMNAILGHDWVDVENGLSEFLDSGWAVPEKWGVWGIGKAHKLKLFLQNPPVRDVQLSADVHVHLGPGQDSKSVDVIVGQQTVATWMFTRKENRSIRTFHVPSSHRIGCDARSSPTISIEFRPHTIESPNMLDPTNPDTRLLGLGVHRISRKC